MKLTPHEQKILDLIKTYPEIVEDNIKRSEIAEANGMSEKTLRNRIGDLKKYGFIKEYQSENSSNIVANPTKIRINTQTDSPDDVSILDYIQVIVKFRKLIFLIFFTISVISAVFSLMIPKTYQSSAVLMAPSYNSSIGLMNAVANLPLGNFDLGLESPESMTFLAILKSRTTIEKVIKEFSLIEYYRLKDIEEAVIKLQDYFDFNIEEEGTVRITARVKTPWFANFGNEDKARGLVKNITNFFVGELDRVNKELKTSQAKFHRIFIEQRLKETKSDLNKAENELRDFQEKYYMIAINEQTKAAIEAAAIIMAQIIANDVKLSVMNKMIQPNHPDIQSLNYENTELQSQLDKMESHSLNSEYGLFPIFEDIPELGVVLSRLHREVEVQNGIFVFLTQQYEEAKLQEAKDTPTIQILDKGVSPIKRVRPHRSMIVYIAGIIGLMVGVFIAFSVEYFDRVKRSGSRGEAVLHDITDLLHGDIKYIKNKIFRKN